MSRELDVFQAWTDEVNKEYKTAKYLYKERDDVLEMLVSSLKSWSEITIDDALSLKRKVKEFLVTEEGKKGKGKHKGWSETVETNYVAAVMRRYSEDKPIEVIKQSFVSNKEDYGIYPFVPRNAIITAWAMDRFGVVWNEQLNLQVHKHSSKFNEEFRKEVLESEWAATGENIPEWYEKLTA